MKGISFLIAAHNEEKIISQTLNNLLSLPYEKYEVLIGLDGCTDNTEKIVESFMKKSVRFKYYLLNLRQGKPAVINFLAKKAKGEIIVIQDADWVFKVKSKKELEKFISIFDRKEIGGIAESFPVEWDASQMKSGNMFYRMVAYSTYYWLLFQKKKFTRQEKDILFVENSNMFLTNILRRSLYKKNTSLGDDFERTQHILKEGYQVVLFKDEKTPRMTAVYNHIKLKDLFRQKIRTAIARRQLQKKEDLSIGFFNYYLPSVFFIFKNAWYDGLYIGFLVTLWILITSLGELISKFKTDNTKKAWLLRARR